MRKSIVLIFAAAVVAWACAPAPVEVRSRGIVLKDETVIHYLEAGQGPVLLLVHGLGGSAEAWRDAMRLLAKRYRVIAPDLPGHGKSDRPKAPPTVGRTAAVIIELIDALAQGRAAVAGNSLGGWAAALVALERPGKVTRLILVDSAGLKRETPPSVSLNPATKQEQQALLAALFADGSRVTPKLVDAQWEYRREVRQTVQATIDSLRTDAPFLDDRLKNIKQPTLIIWGRQDTLTPPELAERFAKGIHGSRTVMIENAGHLPFLERPEAFYDAVKGFVRSW